MKLTTDFIEINGYSRDGTKLKTDKPRFVWHFEGVPRKNRSARGFWEYANHGIPIIEKKHKGFHAGVGDDGACLIVPFDEMAWGCWLKNLNSYTPLYKEISGMKWHAAFYCVHIECRHYDEFGRYTDKTYNNMIQFGVWICEKYDVNPWERFDRHFDITYKKCPRWFVDHPEEWKMFLYRISKG